MNIDNFLDQELQRLKYAPNTIASYKICVRQLVEYFDTDLEDISMEQIEEYILFLINRKKASVSTIRQTTAVLNIVCNQIYKKNFDIKSIRVPKSKRPRPEILSELEVLALIENAKTLKHKVLFALIYSAGLDLSEAIKLKVTDIDFDNKWIKVKQLQGRGTRYAILADYIIDDLEDYLEEYKPTDWLFEGRAEGTHYTVSGVRKAFGYALRLAGISKRVTRKTLRHSYVKHLERQGVPLNVILQELGLAGNSMEFYNQMDKREVQITHSPLDRIAYGYRNRVSIARLEKTPVNSQDVEKLLQVLILGLPRAMHPLQHRRKGMPFLQFDNEYDVQDLIHSLLRPWIKDIRAEDYTPSYAGSSARVDFLLVNYSIVIEVKYVRDSTHAKKIGDELIIDIARYKTLAQCKKLWIVIYDPGKHVQNPGGLRSDLANCSDSIEVQTLVV